MFDLSIIDMSSKMTTVGFVGLFILVVLVVGLLLINRN